MAQRETERGTQCGCLISTALPFQNLHYVYKSAHSSLLALSAALLWAQRRLLTDCQSARAAG